MRKRRRWEERAEDDPLAGLVNLFDLWMVFSIALLIVFAGSMGRKDDRSAPESAPGDVALRKARQIETYRVSDEELNGSGEKLGIAYRLPSGEIVCVPEPGGIAPPGPR